MNDLSNSLSSSNQSTVQTEIEYLEEKLQVLNKLERHYRSLSCFMNRNQLSLFITKLLKTEDDYRSILAGKVDLNKSTFDRKQLKETIKQIIKEFREKINSDIEFENVRFQYQTEYFL